MIAKGNLHGSGANLARYLLKAGKEERSDLWKVRGFDEGMTLGEGFKLVDTMSMGTRCEKPFFHLQVRNSPNDRPLTRAEWERCADRFEKTLGLDDQPRAIAFHIDDKTGEEHMHVAWSRIDEETLRPIQHPFYKLRLKDRCRELERELSLERVRNAREADEPRAPSHEEFEKARRRGVDVERVRRDIASAYRKADGRSEFMEALHEHGYTLAQGDERDFVVVDHQGGIHALGKRLVGASAAEVRTKLNDKKHEPLLSLTDVLRVHETLEDRFNYVSGKIKEVWRDAERRDDLWGELSNWGIFLAKNDRQQPVVVDPHGRTYGITRRLLGDECRAIRNTLPHEKVFDLPTVDDVRRRIPEWDLRFAEDAERVRPHAEPAPKAMPRALGKDAVRMVDAGLGLAADGVANVAEKAIMGFASIFDSAAPPAASALNPKGGDEMATKPQNDPRELDAERMRTTTRDLAHEPATRASIISNPSPAAVEIAREVAERWRKERERDERER